MIEGAASIWLSVPRSTPSLQVIMPSSLLCRLPIRTDQVKCGHTRSQGTTTRLRPPVQHVLAPFPFAQTISQGCIVLRLRQSTAVVEFRSVLIFPGLRSLLADSAHRISYQLKLRDRSPAYRKILPLTALPNRSSASSRICSRLSHRTLWPSSSGERSSCAILHRSPGLR